MSFFRNIIHFFFPPKKDTSMAAVRAALKYSKISTRDRSGSYISDDPDIEENEGHKG